MVDFPLLRGIFGVPVGQIDGAAIARAVDLRAEENDQLDWKLEPYGDTKSDRREIAKDVACFANHRGGLIVLGVGETDSSDGRAAKAEPFGDAASIKRRIDEVVRGRIRPHLPGVVVRLIAAPELSDKHFVVVAVPQSRDAPHAVLADGPQGTRLEYPVRRETATHWRTEGEVAIAYRDRFRDRADVDAAAAEILASNTDVMAAVHENDEPWTASFEAVTAFRSSVWLAVAVAPTQPGSRPPAGAARASEAGFMTTWIARSRHMPAHDFRRIDPGTARVAVRRTVFAGPSSSSTPVALHHDGAGYSAQRLTKQRPVYNPAPNPSQHPRSVSSDEIEWRLFTSLTLLAEHAIDTGAAGELEIRARLAVRDLRYLAVAVPYPDAASGSGFTHTVPDDSTWQSYVRGQHPVVASAAIPLEEYDYRTTARAAHELATDILAEFGVDEPRLFGPDGHVTPENWASTTDGGDAGEWAAAHIDPSSDERA